MPIFKAWDIVKVPFPYTDRPVRQHRPALVIAADHIETEYGLQWVLMITSAENRRWADDVVISDLDAAGLPAPSMVRCAKIATIEARDAERIGSLPSKDRARVADNISRTVSSVVSRATK
jgi:mRNA interferase MazF